MWILYILHVEIERRSKWRIKNKARIRKRKRRKKRSQRLLARSNWLMLF
jgi:hypothetical protein